MPSLGICVEPGAKPTVGSPVPLFHCFWRTNQSNSGLSQNSTPPVGVAITLPGLWVLSSGLPESPCFEPSGPPALGPLGAALALDRFAVRRAVPQREVADLVGVEAVGQEELLE